MSARLAQVRVSERQRRFAQEFLVDCNATQAAIRAGYAARSADVIGARLRRHPGVAILLAEHAAEAGRQLQLTVQRLEQELARVAFVDPRRAYDQDGKLLPIDQLPEDVARAIAGFEEEALFDTVVTGVGPRGGVTKERVQVGVVRKVRWHSKVEAIHLGLKRLGALTERHELVTPANVHISIGVGRKKSGAGGATS